MIRTGLKTVEDVVIDNLCMGCGNCAAACGCGAVSLVDIPSAGMRPRISIERCTQCGNCVESCPGVGFRHDEFPREAIEKLKKAWGPVLELWEGFAFDPEIRYRGSSGGLVTALAHFCLAEEQMRGVLQIRDDPEIPWQNIPVFSRNREDLLASTGSRYSPASVCEKLDWIKDSDGPCVFVGKPCDVAGLRKRQKIDRKLNKNVGLAISIFCAGTPTSDGTKAMLNALGVEPESVEQLRYRGCGWPGPTVAKIKGQKAPLRQMSYQRSWGDILSNYGQSRCSLCPDSTGEFADIACGDPWHREILASAPGLSLVLVRTQRGRQILHKAIKAGYVYLYPVQPEVLALSQPALLNKRRRLFGRLMARRTMFMPVPVYSGFSLFSNWCCLSLYDKARSILGLFKHIVSGKWGRLTGYLQKFKIRKSQICTEMSVNSVLRKS